MGKDFIADCLPTLIGSFPMDDHVKATMLVLEYTPEIPLWVQLPVYRKEGMIAQFLPGLPGHVNDVGKDFVRTDDELFEADILHFYEDYIAVTGGDADIGNSRFALKMDTARGFFDLIKQVEALSAVPVALKGQITGPVTLGTSVKDQSGRSVFYDERVRDMVVKILALKSKWQVKQLSKFGCPVIIFFDEPALTGFGSSEFISISREEIVLCFEEVIDAVHQEGGLAGIHVCANAEWSLVLESSADIISFDAYSFFERFILYPEQIKKFIGKGGILAWGIVPTLNADDLEKETAESLIVQLEEKIKYIEKLGINRQQILKQSLITPSCGTGSLTFDQAIKVLGLTREVSDQIRKKYKISRQ